jgi:phosphoribosyl 1,2-cyclic phosphate phosphodiesterase
MKITLLGTGTSSGVPVLTCECEVCSSTNLRDKRLRSSVLIQDKGVHVVIDTGPDLREQLLRTGLKSLDAVVYTHEHKDHTAGLDDVRPFNYLQGKQHLNLYGAPNVLEQLKREYHYAFSEERYPGIPLLRTNEISENPFYIDHLKFIPIQVLHHKLPVMGFRIGDFSYITDANFIAESELEKIKGSKVLVLDALQRNSHISHFTLDEAVSIALEINAEKTYFTHISHKMGMHEAVNAMLPEKMELGYDGLMFEL